MEGWGGELPVLCPMSTAPARLEQVLHVLPFDQDAQAPSPVK